MYIPLWLLSLLLAIALSWFLMARIDSPNFRNYMDTEKREKQIKQLKEFRKNPYMVLFMVLFIWISIYGFFVSSKDF